MRSLTACLGLVSLFAMSPLSAHVVKDETVTIVEDRDTGGERSLRFAQQPVAPAPIPRGQAYGPFRVVDATHAALVDVTDARTPAQFTAMLRDHPGIVTIDMVECPGTEDDLSNLRLGHLIRERGIATHVPRGGSVRSGAVELFLAGAHRYADEGSEFAVHSWLDDTGLEPGDYGAAAPENQRYIDYYRQMGMSLAEAQAFYAMTNSVPFSSALWFGANEMKRWVRLENAASMASAAGFSKAGG